jgi:hypothetical protein
MSTTDNTAPLDLLSDEFADFAESELENDRPKSGSFAVEGQEFTGRVLGFGSSRALTDKHTGHMPGTRPAGKVRCGKCRWADVVVMSVDAADGTSMYLVATMGKSAVPGEDQRATTTWTADALEVLHAMVVSGKNGAPAKIPFPNATAFRTAAEADDAIDAVLERNEDIVPNYDPRDAAMGV